jgi:hypothetical protein
MNAHGASQSQGWPEPEDFARLARRFGLAPQPPASAPVPVPPAPASQIASLHATPSWASGSTGSQAALGGPPTASAAPPARREPASPIERMHAQLDQLDTGRLYEQVFADLARIDTEQLFERAFANLARLRSSRLYDHAFAFLQTFETWPMMEWAFANFARLETVGLHGRVSASLSRVRDGYRAASTFSLLMREGLGELAVFVREHPDEPAVHTVLRDLGWLVDSLPDARAGGPVPWDPWFRAGLYLAAALLMVAKQREATIGTVLSGHLIDTAVGIMSLVLAYDAFRGMARAS